MSLNYISTRGLIYKKTASQAILEGIAKDGGLYVPENIPTLDMDLDKLIGLNYQDMAYEILKLYLTDFTEEELKYCINSAYDSKFDTELIAPLKSVGDYNFLELFHGRTLAFKDMALSILPYFMKVSARKNGVDKKIVILTATSGDTGKAALEGFAKVDGIDIIVFYPQDGVSDVQRLQMVTQEGDNTCVVGVNGNFDDTQTGVKNIFTDKETVRDISKKGYMFSSANSINIGRLVPQIVYYFYAYAQMVNNKKITLGEKLDFTVPTGNFGNILAGFYAKQMGLPIDNLICASNSNKVLTDFFNTGTYDRNREFILTKSPSMDILISSNLERLLYHITKDSKKISELMTRLSTDGAYTQNTSEIIGEYCNEEECLASIKNMFEKGYLMDTHTAVAVASYDKVKKEKGLTNKNVVVSTASPYKFSDSVLEAISSEKQEYDVHTLLNKLSEVSKTEIPYVIKDLDKKEVLHKMNCNKENMVDIVKGFLMC